MAYFFRYAHNNREFHVLFFIKYVSSPFVYESLLSSSSFARGLWNEHFTFSVVIKYEKQRWKENTWNFHVFEEKEIVYIDPICKSLIYSIGRWTSFSLCITTTWYIKSIYTVSYMIFLILDCFSTKGVRFTSWHPSKFSY